jgi:broad specificity phosphatase PhoE
MLLYVLRHAEKINTPVWNSDKKFDDRGISEHGKFQSLCLCDYFKDKNIQHVFVSEYARTLETILPFCTKTGITPQLDTLLNEIDVGTISDPATSPEEVTSLLENYEHLKNEEKDFMYSGGESGFDVFRRIRHFLEKLADLDGNTVAISHEGWIKLLVCLVLDLDPGKRFRLFVDTCGLVELQRVNSGWKIHCPGIV